MGHCHAQQLVYTFYPLSHLFFHTCSSSNDLDALLCRTFGSSPKHPIISLLHAQNTLPSIPHPWRQELLLQSTRWSRESLPGSWSWSLPCGNPDSRCAWLAPIRWLGSSALPCSPTCSYLWRSALKPHNLQVPLCTKISTHEATVSIRQWSCS